MQLGEGSELWEEVVGNNRSMARAILTRMEPSVEPEQSPKPPVRLRSALWAIHSQLSLWYPVIDMLQKWTTSEWLLEPRVLLEEHDKGNHIGQGVATFAKQHHLEVSSDALNKLQHIANILNWTELENCNAHSILAGRASNNLGWSIPTNQS